MCVCVCVCVCVRAVRPAFAEPSLAEFYDHLIYAMKDYPCLYNTITQNQMILEERNINSTGLLMVNEWNIVCVIY